MTGTGQTQTLLVGGHLAVVKSHLRNSDVVCRCGGTTDPGAVCSRLSPPVPVLTEAMFTPAELLRGPAPSTASPTQPVGECGKVLAELAVSWGRGEQTPMPVGQRRTDARNGTLRNRECKQEGKTRREGH